MQLRCFPVSPWLSTAETPTVPTMGRLEDNAATLFSGQPGCPKQWTPRGCPENNVAALPTDSVAQVSRAWLNADNICVDASC